MRRSVPLYTSCEPSAPHIPSSKQNISAACDRRPRAWAPSIFGAVHFDRWVVTHSIADSNLHGHRPILQSKRRPSEGSVDERTAFLDSLHTLSVFSASPVLLTSSGPLGSTERVGSSFSFPLVFRPRNDVTNSLHSSKESQLLNSHWQDKARGTERGLSLFPSFFLSHFRAKREREETERRRKEHCSHLFLPRPSSSLLVPKTSSLPSSVVLCDHTFPVHPRTFYVLRKEREKQ